MYERKTWKNRETEFPGRRRMTAVDGQEDVYDISREEGLVLEEGDAFDADTMNNLEERIKKGFEQVQHPIGYIFDWAPVAGQNVDLSTPEKVAQHFGYGTWQEITGRFTFGRDASHEVGSTGGEETHALTNPELPAHNHNTSIGFKNLYVARNTAQDILAGGLLTTSGFSDFMNYTTGNTGNGNAHNNMPPYLTVYKWQRIA